MTLIIIFNNNFFLTESVLNAKFLFMRSGHLELQNQRPWGRLYLADAHILGKTARAVSFVISLYMTF